MANFKRQLKNIVGFVSIGILSASILGVAVKEKDNTGKIANQSSAPDFQNEDINPSTNLKTGDERQKVCRDFFEANENTLAVREYSRADIVECGTVGCGGIF